MGTEPYIAEVILFAGNFAPRGWAFCNGQILSIAQNTALFSLIGTTYGGDGQTTFALPDLRGRVPVQAGQGPGLPPVSLGEQGGAPSHTLTVNEMPQHQHQNGASAADQTTNRPTGGVVPSRGGAYGPADSAGTSTLGAGGSQPHNNMQPYLGLHYIIALEGIFPSRN